MTILTFPSVRKPPRLDWRLVANTQVHESPLDKTTQTLAMPGAHWAATLAWPALEEGDWRKLSAFLARLQGRAGRFAFGPVHAPRRAAGTASRTNWVPNSAFLGAAPGVWPDGWTFVTDGAVVGAGIDAGLEYIDVRFEGTAAATGAVGAVILAPAARPATGPGMSWAAQAVLQVIGAVSGTVTGVQVAALARAGGATVQIGGSQQTALAPLQSGPTLRAGAVTITNPTANRADMRVAVLGTSGEAYGVTLRIQAPQLEHGTEPTAYIRTTGSPATVYGDVVVNGAGQSGAVLSTRGWDPGALAFREGDFLSYQDPAGRWLLHQVTQDVTANGQGVAAAPIAPPIRRAGADGAPVEVANPVGVFRLAADENGMGHSPAYVASLTLDIVEALV